MMMESMRLLRSSWTLLRSHMHTDMRTSMHTHMRTSMHRAVSTTRSASSKTTPSGHPPVPPDAFACARNQLANVQATLHCHPHALLAAESGQASAALAQRLARAIDYLRKHWSVVEGDGGEAAAVDRSVSTADRSSMSTADAPISATGSTTTSTATTTTSTATTTSSTALHELLTTFYGRANERSVFLPNIDDRLSTLNNMPLPLPTSPAITRIPLDPARLQRHRPSQFFSEAAERMIVCMSMHTRQARRHLCEAVVMEAVLGNFQDGRGADGASVDGASSKTAHVTPTTSSSSSSGLGLLDRLFTGMMVGLHPDHAIRIKMHRDDLTSGGADTTTTTATDTSSYDYELTGTVDYLFTPHFRQREAIDTPAATTADAPDYFARSVAMVVLAEPHEHLMHRLSVMYPVVRAWFLRQLMEQGVVGGGSRRREAEKDVTMTDSDEHSRIILRPLNVVVTDGLRWQFVRIHPFQSQMNRNLHLSAATTTTTQQQQKPSDIDNTASLDRAYNARMIRDHFAVDLDTMVDEWRQSLPGGCEDDTDSSDPFRELLDDGVDVRVEREMARAWLRDDVLGKTAKETTTSTSSDGTSSTPSMLSMSATPVLSMTKDQGSVILALLRYWSRGMALPYSRETGSAAATAIAARTGAKRGK